MKPGIIYYTDNRIGAPIIPICQKQLLEAAGGIPITSCSLRPMAFGDRNIVLEGRERSYPTMVDQILLALENSQADFVFFCEHDVLYHPSHFEFAPERGDIYYYNINNWRWHYPHDRAINYSGLTSLSQMCAIRTLALDHFQRRAARIEELGWDKIRSREPRWARLIGYEPGTKKTRNGGFSDEQSERWKSSFPNIDIRHNRTFSSPKIHLTDFRHPPTDWRERTLDELEGWNLKSLFGL